MTIDRFIILKIIKTIKNTPCLELPYPQDKRKKKKQY